MLTFKQRKELKSELRDVKRFVREEMRKPFQNQSIEAINAGNKRAKEIEKELMPVTPKKMEKQEFIETLKKEFSLEEPDDILEINSIQELNTAWEHILTGKYMIKAGSQAIHDEVAKRMKALANRTHLKGFR